MIQKKQDIEEESQDSQMLDSSENDTQIKSKKSQAKIGKSSSLYLDISQLLRSAKNLNIWI